MRLAALIGNVLLLIIVTYILVEEGVPRQTLGQGMLLIMLFSSVTSLVVLIFGDSDRITDLKRQVKEAELEKQLDELKKG